MNEPIVTLTTDWGDSDFFAGMVKGMLYQYVKGVRVVDINHKVKAYNIIDASFVVKYACFGFPEGTIHIIDVATVQPFLVLKVMGQYFLCCDNGLPTAVFGDRIEEAYVLPTKENGIYNFAALSIFTQAAVNIANGVALSSLGQPAPPLKKRTIQTYFSYGDEYRIYVNYYDTYGNAYLGMTYREFEQLRAGRPFVMIIRDQEIKEISIGYYNRQPNSDPRDKLQLTVSATGLLELAVMNGSFKQLFGIPLHEQITLKFK